MISTTLSHICAIILDLDGTLTRGSQPMPGLAEFFVGLRERDIAFTIATNNTSKTPDDYAHEMATFGIPMIAENVLTASIATAEYLAEQLAPGANLFVIGEFGLRTALQEAGFNLTGGGDERVEAVVVGGDRTLTYDKLRDAVHHLLAGARLIGANPDLLLPTAQGFDPEAGVTLAALQAATDIAPTIIGKPERPLLELALARMNATPSQTAILGDRLETDILGGQRLGLSTIFITTGADAESDIAAKGIRPDFVVHGLDQVIGLWENQL